MKTRVLEERPSRQRNDPGLVLAALFVPTSALYFLLAPEKDRFASWLLLFSAQFALYLALALVMRRRGPIPVSAILLFALVSRVLLWFAEPVFAADYYRYLWDGHVFSEGVNPYLYPPEDPALDDIETDYRFFIQWSQYRTIYPPGAQYVFALAHFLAPDSLLVLKVVLTLFDVATGALLVVLFHRRGLHGSWSFLYLLNPLVLKEVACSAHVDAVPVFFATAALYLFESRKSAWSWIALALSAGSKLYAAIVVPLFARLDASHPARLLVALFVGLLLYLPFLDAGARLFSGALAFGRYWIFNASFFRLANALSPTPEAAKLAVALLLLALTSWRVYRLRDRRGLSSACLFVLGALLLLSPVVNAWYLLWLLPFASLERSVPFLAWTYLVGLSYSWFHSSEGAYVFQIIEYGCLFALFVWTRGRAFAVTNGTGSRLFFLKH